MWEISHARGRARGRRGDSRASSFARIDGGDTKSPNDGVDASNREDDERNAVVGTCRVCLEDISREDVEMGKVVSLGCACVSSGRVHDTVVSRRVRRRERAAERACEICLRPLSAAFISLDRSKRALVVDIDAIDRSGRARVRDARRGVARDRSLDAAESGCSRGRGEALRVRRVRVRATRERFCARAHRSRRARVRESRSTDVTRVDGERRARRRFVSPISRQRGTTARDRIRVGIHRRRRRPRRDNEIEGRRGNARDAWTRARGRERARRRRETRKIRLLGTDRSIGFEQTSNRNAS